MFDIAQGILIAFIPIALCVLGFIVGERRIREGQDRRGWDSYAVIALGIILGAIIVALDD